VVALAISLTACAADPPSSVVGISVTGCPPDTANGTGVVIEPGLVLASAHVLKGADVITVDTRAGRTGAEIVAFDPEMDLALLRLETDPPRSLPVAQKARDQIEPGKPGRAYVFRDGAVAVLDVRVRRPITIHTEDIYIEGDTFRPGFELEAAIEAGDSGGPVVIDGELVGVLWARSTKAERRAYAIDPVAAGTTIRTQLADGEIDESIDLTRCN
jgi:S1-C subfamily serine protease